MRAHAQRAGANEWKNGGIEGEGERVARDQMRFGGKRGPERNMNESETERDVHVMKTLSS